MYLSVDLCLCVALDGKREEGVGSKTNTARFSSPDCETRVGIHCCCWRQSFCRVQVREGRSIDDRIVVRVVIIKRVG